VYLQVIFQFHKGVALKSLLALLLSVFLVTGSILTGSCTSREASNKTFVREVTPQEAFDLIQDNQNNSDFLIIDVRTSEEFTNGHIGGAINIDYYQQIFEGEIGKLDKGKTYLIYCRSGHRSREAVDIMEELGFRKIYNLSDGIVAWNFIGLPIMQ